MAKLGSNESKMKIFDSRIDLIKTWDKKDAIQILLPQQVLDGKFLNFKGQVIMGHDDGEDCLFHDDDALVGVTRITPNFLLEFMSPIEDYLNGRTEVDEDDTEVDEDDTEIDFNLLDEVQTLIGKDKLKKAKKLIADYEDHDDYKKAKKLIKKAKGV
jgi:hypothetical protein